jgi:hypothetical protein
MWRTTLFIVAEPTLRQACRRANSISTPNPIINYKETKTKCRIYWCLIEFIDWIHSHVGIFRPSFVNYCPPNLPTGSNPPPLYPYTPLPKVKVQYILYRQCVAGRGWGCWVVLETIFCRSLTLCYWPDSEPTKLLYNNKQKPGRRGGGASDR